MPKKPNKKTASNTNAFLYKPAGYILTGLALLALAYVFGSLALDSGSILQWTLALIALLWGIRRFVQGIMHKL